MLYLRNWSLSLATAVLSLRTGFVHVQKGLRRMASWQNAVNQGITVASWEVWSVIGRKSWDNRIGQRKNIVPS